MSVAAPARNFRRKVIAFGAAFCGLCFAAEVPRSNCLELLGGIAPDSATARFIKLLEYLAHERPLLSAQHLELLQAEKPINPLAGDFPGTETYVFRTAFDDILKDHGLKWAKVREASKIIANTLSQSKSRSTRAHEKAKNRLAVKMLNPKFVESEGALLHAAYLSKNRTLFVQYMANHQYYLFNNSPNAKPISISGFLTSRAFFEKANGEVLFYGFTGGTELSVWKADTGELIKQIPTPSEATPPQMGEDKVHGVLLGFEGRVVSLETGKDLYLKYSPERIGTYRTSHGESGLLAVSFPEGRENVIAFDAASGNELASVSENEHRTVRGFLNSRNHFFFAHLVGAVEFPDDPFIETADGRTLFAFENLWAVCLRDLVTQKTMRADVPDLVADLHLLERDRRVLIVGLGREDRLLYVSDFTNNSTQEIRVPDFAPSWHRTKIVAAKNDGPVLLVGDARDSGIAVMQIYGPP